MPNLKLVGALAVAAILLGSSIFLFHENYDAKPYIKVKIPQLYAGEQRMFSFSTLGTSIGPDNNGTYILEGYVYNENGKPLINTNITIFDFPWDVQTITNSTGGYKVEVLLFGTFTMGITSKGYSQSLFTFTNLNGRNVWENVTLKKAYLYSVTGYAYTLQNGNNSSKVKVPDVNIFFRNFYSTYNTLSNNTGNFSVKLQNSNYLIYVEKSGFSANVTPEFLNVSGKNITNLKLELKLPNNILFTINGTVFNKLNQPISTGIDVEDVFDGRVVSNSTTLPDGSYSISVPEGYNELYFKGTGFNLNQTGEIFVNSSINNLNMSLTAWDPFNGQPLNSQQKGLGFLPSFLKSEAENYLKSTSSINYKQNEKVFSKIQISNSFYSEYPQNISFENKFYGVIAGNFNGTIYYDSVLLNRSAITELETDFPGIYNIILYIPGFSLISLSADNGIHSNIYYENAVPLSGQTFNLTGSGINSVNGNPLYYSNYTLFENGIPVSSEDYVTDGSYRFEVFVDTHQSYTLNFTVDLQENGFISQNYSIIVNSTKTSNPGIFKMGDLGLIPVKSIGEGFTENVIPVACYELSSLEKNLTENYTTNHQSSSLSGNLFAFYHSNSLLGSTSMYALVYLNGVIYGKVFNTSTTGFLDVELNLSVSGYISFYSQYYKSINNRFTALPGNQSFEKINMNDRNITTFNIDILNTLYKYEVENKLNLNYETLPANIYSFNSLIYFKNSTSEITPEFRNFTFEIPRGNFVFRYGNYSSIVMNQTTVNTASSKTITVEMNVSEYSSLIFLNSTIPVDIYIQTMKGNSVNNYLIGTFKNAVLTNVTMNQTYYKVRYYFKAGGTVFESRYFAGNYTHPLYRISLDISNSTEIIQLNGIYSNSKYNIIYSNDTFNFLPGSVLLYNISLYRYDSTIEYVMPNGTYFVLDGSQFYMNNSYFSDINMNITGLTGKNSLTFYADYSVNELSSATILISCHLDQLTLNYNNHYNVGE
ncbi:carboxypeptidase-like regulatory domain-containing protein [Caldiplasma sukawensis]